MTNTTKAGPVLPPLDLDCLAYSPATLRAYAEEYAEHVAGPLRDQLGQCFRLSGADPDGNESWRLAPRAVDAVRQLRADYDEACDEGEKLRERIAELERLVELYRVQGAERDNRAWLAMQAECGARGAELDRLRAECEAKDAVIADSRRLAAEIGQVLDGAGAATAPSLCDLIEPVRKLRMQNDMLRAECGALRDLLCSAHAGALAYRDDGEMQDNTVHPFIDFKRDTPEQILAALRRRAEAALAGREGK